MNPNDIAAEVAFRYKHSLRHQYPRPWRTRWQTPLGLVMLFAAGVLLGRLWP